eukprot:gene25367-biopygen1443
MPKRYDENTQEIHRKDRIPAPEVPGMDAFFGAPSRSFGRHFPPSLRRSPIPTASSVPSRKKFCANAWSLCSWSHGHFATGTTDNQNTLSKRAILLERLLPSDTCTARLAPVRPQEGRARARWRAPPIPGNIPMHRRRRSVEEANGASVFPRHTQGMSACTLWRLQFLREQIIHSTCSNIRNGGHVPPPTPLLIKSPPQGHCRTVTVAQNCSAANAPAMSHKPAPLPMRNRARQCEDSREMHILVPGNGAEGNREERRHTRTRREGTDGFFPIWILSAPNASRTQPTRQNSKKRTRPGRVLSRFSLCVEQARRHPPPLSAGGAGAQRAPLREGVVPEAQGRECAQGLYPLQAEGVPCPARPGRGEGGEVRRQPAGLPPADTTTVQGSWHPPRAILPKVRQRRRHRKKLEKAQGRGATPARAISCLRSACLLCLLALLVLLCYLVLTE